MACIDRRPGCGQPKSDVIPEPLSDIFAAFAWIFGAIGVVGTILGIWGKIAVVEGVLTIGGIAIGGAAVAGVLSSVVAALTVIAIVGLYAYDRCVSRDGLAECVAGVVEHVEESFSSALDEIFPFSAMHDRVDLVVKSRYWDVVEHGQAFVHCTDEVTPRRSEIMRSYFYDRQVCDAATGAQTGAAVGAGVGIIAGVLVAAAIGCATVILCLLAIIVAAIVAAAVTLAGAFAGGQIGKATSEDDSPTADGVAIGVGDLITTFGTMVRRESDDGANTLWWVNRANLHGQASGGLPRPYSYCEIDEELASDACPVPEPNIR